MNIQKKWVALTPRVQRLWKVAATVMLLTFSLIFFAVVWRLETEWKGKFEKQDSTAAWQFVMPFACSLVGICIGQIWQKSDEEIWEENDEEADADNFSKKWKNFWLVAATLIITLALLAVWPNGTLGIGLVAVNLILIIKIWAETQ
jgi:ABC-type branched-subunit amino acid transport system permease subunit